MPYRAILVDDDANATASLELIIKEFCPAISVEGSFTNPLDAIKNINQNPPDIIFLDIDMPQMTGFEMLEFIPDRVFEIIFVTAFNDRAIEAFKANAIDYILKPVNIQEVINAANKAIKHLQIKNPTVDRYEEILKYFRTQENRKLAVKNFDGIEFINHDDIIYIDADGAYSTLHTIKKNITISKNLKELSTEIDSAQFVRIHNSHIININHIKKISLKDMEVELSHLVKLSISKRCREEFLEVLKDHHFL